MEGLGILPNDSGGKIKECADGKLRQRSAVGQLVEGEFWIASGGLEREPISGL